MKNPLCILASILLLSMHVLAQDSYQAFIDSLEQVLEKPAESERELLYTYVKLADMSKHVDPVKAMEYTRRGTLVALEKENLYWTAEFYYMTGDIFSTLSQLDSALYYFNLSSEFQKLAVEAGTEDKEQNGYLELYLLNEIAFIHSSRGEFNAALELYLQGLPIAEGMDDPEEVIKGYNYLADTYYKMSNLEQAESYLLKAKQLAIEVNDSVCMADANLNLCPILNARGEYAKALEYAEEAYRIFLSHTQMPTSFNRLMSAAMRLTETWMKIPDYNKAMEYAQATVTYARRAEAPANQASALYTLSTVYLRQGKYTECEQAAFEALAADSTNIYINAIIYGNIAQANIWMGKAKKGIEYFGKTLDAHRAYSNKNFQASLSEMEVKYETEKKELLITELEKEKRLMAWLGLSGAAILLLVLALFLFLWRLAVQKKRVAEQQHQLAEQQIKQLEQEKQLVATQAVLDGETAERTRLARDLHDGLGSMLTGIKLNLEYIKGGVLQNKVHVKQFDNTLEMLNESIIELRRVAHHLMPDSLNRYGLKAAISDFCDNFPSVEFNYFGNDKRFDPKKEVVIYRIIHELVNNALKHSAASQIVVQVMHEAEYVAFIVRDNGSGFDVTSHTGGIGLKNIRDRVASFNGRMEVYSKPGEGTEINIEFSIND